MNAQKLAACTGSTLIRAATFESWLTLAMETYGIDTPVRQAHFLAQIGHESGGLRYTTEIWGPTPAQSRYEGRLDLGNTRPGDGSRFRGHGLIQTTGRSNHAKTRDRLRKLFEKVPDFEAFPVSLAEPQWAALSAGDYWDMRDINVAADSGSIERVTRLINGGTNGLADRKARTLVALRTLTV
jgi:putative chitinase